jgi:hypothetical protein
VGIFYLDTFGLILYAGITIYLVVMLIALVLDEKERREK